MIHPSPRSPPQSSAISRLEAATLGLFPIRRGYTMIATTPTRDPAATSSPRTGCGAIEASKTAIKGVKGGSPIGMMAHKHRPCQPAPKRAIPAHALLLKNTVADSTSQRHPNPMIPGGHWLRRRYFRSESAWASPESRVATKTDPALQGQERGLAVNTALPY